MKWIKLLIIIVLIFSFPSIGCSVLEKLQGDRSADKPRGEILESDARQFVFGDNTYTILNETVGREEINAWIGITGSLCFLNKENEILKTIGNLSYKNYWTELTKEIPSEANDTAQFENIYSLKDNRLAIVVDGEFHVAKPSSSLSTGDEMIQFRALHGDREEETEFCINPKNAGELLHGEIVYKVTEESLSREDEGRFLQAIGTQVVFDEASGQIIPKSEYTKVELIPGKLSNQNRKSYFYGSVYEIAGVAESEAVMVEINEKLLRAEAVN
ncbi:NisI/SpaI family lantibiotic immunity lipoprotein [Anaerotignum sp.]|uniref:NisI/SpaI family lantibiotic immunity lipoprotein n=1 Tax=Anaerotignum sp. TaxID=2039241 RepID=UPI0027148770|nr:NisI/SpaI family lantibiotic immunity lipoprotein [Anaerotignum sp.]